MEKQIQDHLFAASSKEKKKKAAFNPAAFELSAVGFLRS